MPALTVLGRGLVVVLSVLMVLPRLSSRLTWTAGLMLVPAVVVLGWVVNASLAGAPGSMVKLLLGGGGGVGLLGGGGGGPAVVVLGWVVNASLAGAPGSMVKLLLVVGVWLGLLVAVRV